jgi:hypothetical protein
MGALGDAVSQNEEEEEAGLLKAINEAKWTRNARIDTRQALVLTASHAGEEEEVLLWACLLVLSDWRSEWFNDLLGRPQS